MVLEKLTLGEMVVWDREIYPAIMLSVMVQKFGEGPFKIVGLRIWTKEPTNTFVAPYVVTVELPNGAQENFAGEWFKRA